MARLFFGAIVGSGVTVTVTVSVKVSVSVLVFVKVRVSVTVAVSVIVAVNVSMPVSVIVEVKVMVGEVVAVTVWVLDCSIRSHARVFWQESIPCRRCDGGQEIGRAICSPVSCWEGGCLNCPQT